MTGRGEFTITTAIKRGFFQQIRFLIELGHDVNGRDEEGKTPLMLCALVSDENWAVGIARLLLEKNASVGKRDKQGLNALHYACLYQRQELTQVYLRAIDYDLNQGDKLGNTPLFYAVTVGNSQITRQLIEVLHRYKLTVDKCNVHGLTPLIQSWKTGHILCAQILIREGGADEEFVDGLEGKNSKQWEEETLAKLEAIRSAPKRQRIPLFQRRSTTQRVSSAPLLRNRHGTSNALFSNNELPMPLKKQTELIRSASISDLRNNPEFVFHVTPMEYFGQQQSDYHHHHPMGGHSRLRGSARQRSSSWRGEVKTLFGEFGVQTSPSYRTSVKPPPPRPSSRPSTPQLSDSVSDVCASDRGSVTSRKSGRKGSEIPNPMDRKFARRNSNASLLQGNYKMGRRMSITASNESVNSINASKLQRRKSGGISLGGNINVDTEEDSDAGKLPPRPMSRASHHRSVPMVKETPAEGRPYSADNANHDKDPKFLSPYRAMDE